MESNQPLAQFANANFGLGDGLLGRVICETNLPTNEAARWSTDQSMASAVAMCFVGGQVELSMGDALQQSIQPRSPVPPLGADNALISVGWPTRSSLSRPAASWRGCTWFSMVWPRLAVETRS